MNRLIELGRIVVSSLGFFCFQAFGASSALTAHDIMLKNEEARQLSTVIASATLTTGAKEAPHAGASDQKVKKFTWWRKLNADQVHFSTLTRFSEPAEVRNEGILFFERSLGKNEILLYLPNFKKIRRVESQSQSGSFMGSEFSYSDIATPHVEDFDYEQKKIEKCPDLTALNCFVIQAKPKTIEISDRTGYAQSIYWIREDCFMLVKAEHYNKELKLFKVLYATNTQKIDTTKNKWMSLKIEMENLINMKKTVIDFKNVKANTEISDSVFTQQNLMRE